MTHWLQVKNQLPDYIDVGPLIMSFNVGLSAMTSCTTWIAYDESEIASTLAEDATACTSEESSARLLVWCPWTLESTKTSKAGMVESALYCSTTSRLCSPMKVGMVITAYAECKCVALLLGMVLPSVYAITLSQVNATNISACHRQIDAMVATLASKEQSSLIQNEIGQLPFSMQLCRHGSQFPATQWVSTKSLDDFNIGIQFGYPMVSLLNPGLARCLI